MWYFRRNSDGKEFMLASLFMNMVNGVAADGEKCALFNNEYGELYKKKINDAVQNTANQLPIKKQHKPL